MLEVIEEQLRLGEVIDSVPALLWTARPDGFIEYCNREWRQFTGMTSEAILGSGWMDALHPDDLQSTSAAWETACREGTPYQVEQRLRSKDGRYRWFLTRAAPQRNPEGKVIKWFGVNTDITEHKAAQEFKLQNRVVLAVNAQEKLLSTMVNHLPAGVLLARGREMKIEVVNPLYKAIAPGKDFKGCISEVWKETWPQIGPIFERVLETGAPYSAEDDLFHIQRTPKSPLEPAYFTWSLIRIRLPGGDWGLLLTAIETTARKIAEERLRSLTQVLKEQTDSLKEANAELDSFCYSVSHDLRAPLRAINGFAKMVINYAGEKLDAESHRWLQVICNESVRMGHLIDDLLQFSRTSRLNLSLHPVDMTRLACEAFQECKSREPQREIQLEIGSLPMARADENMLGSVWSNLIANAFKFTRNKSPARIEINGCLEKDRCVYWVRDNGVGFDMRHANRIFEVFQRLHPQEQFEGTGVGLALVQRIIRRHGGKVWAEAPPDSGASFYFDLPCSTEPPLKTSEFTAESEVILRS